MPSLLSHGGQRLCADPQHEAFFELLSLSATQEQTYIQHIVRIGITVIVVYSALALSVWERASSASGRPHTNTAYYLLRQGKNFCNP